jgi:hypothetical protein
VSSEGAAARSLVQRPAVLLGIGAVVAIVAFQLWITSSNPPGSHRDEAALSYNAYSISTSLRDEDGSVTTRARSTRTSWQASSGSRGLDYDDRGAQARRHAAESGLPRERVQILPDGGIPPKGSTVFGLFQECDYVCTKFASWEHYWLARAIGPKPG